MDRLTAVGRYTLALAMAGFGFQFLAHLWFGGPVPGPFWNAVGTIEAILIGGGLVIGAACIVSGWKARLAALLLGLLLLLRAIVVHLPDLVEHPRNPGFWTGILEVIAIAGALLVLARELPSGRDGRMLWHARLLYALPLVGFAVQHFMYPAFVADLIPSWIPARLFLTWLVGFGFVAAAIAITFNVLRRPAGIVLGSMFLLWLLVLHGPRVLGALHNGNEWTSFIIALAMAGGAFVVGGANRDEHQD